MVCAVWRCALKGLQDLCNTPISQKLQPGLGVAAPWDFKGLPTAAASSTGVQAPRYGKMPDTSETRYKLLEHNLAEYVRQNYRASAEGKQRTVPPQPPHPPTHPSPNQARGPLPRPSRRQTS